MKPVAVRPKAATCTTPTRCCSVGAPDHSAQRLIGLGVLAAVPTAWTGWAEWSGAPTEQQRVGVVHVAAFGLTATGFIASWLARRRGEQARGVRLGLASAAALVATGFLGGHLSAIRKR